MESQEKIEIVKVHSIVTSLLFERHLNQVFVLQNFSNLLGTDGIVLFDLWKLPINSFYNKTDVSPLSKERVVENLMKVLKSKFPEVFFEGVAGCTKTKLKFDVK